MPAGKHNLIVEQGATFRKTITWKTDAGSPIDNTGYTARMQIRPSVESPTLLLELTTENGRISLGGTNGEINLLLAATTTAAIIWTSGVYDLEMISPTATVTRLLQGTVSVSPEVTR